MIVWPKGDDLLIPIGRVYATPDGTEYRDDIRTRRFALALSGDRVRRGTLWVDAATGAIIEAQVDRPDYPGMKDFRLVLDRVNAGGAMSWTRLLLGHYALCATAGCNHGLLRSLGCAFCPGRR